MNPAEPGAQAVRLETVVTGTAANNFHNISQDGCLVSYTDWAGGGDLFIRDSDGKCLQDSSDPATPGTTQQRITNAGSWSESYSFASFPVLSHDGLSVAWLWWSEGGYYSLKVQALDGEDPRTLYQAKLGLAFYPTWSPDGKKIALSVPASARPNRIALIDVMSGALEILDFGTPPSGNIAFSPDGRYLLLDTLAHDGRPEQDPRTGQHYLAETFGPQQGDIFGCGHVDEQHDNDRQGADDCR